MTSAKLNVVMPETLDERLENISERTGLNKSEITRRALLREIQELEVEEA
ncbi:MAG: ribbon-helix-helix domain-containing protein [Candidatus Aenigmatarchaeota archaeon]